MAERHAPCSPAASLRHHDRLFIACLPLLDLASSRRVPKGSILAKMSANRTKKPYSVRLIFLPRFVTLLTGAYSDLPLALQAQTANGSTTRLRVYRELCKTL